MTGSKILTLVVSACILFLACFLFFQLSEAPTTITEIPSFKDKAALLSSQTPLVNITPTVFQDETFVRGITHRHAQKKDKLASFEDTLGSGVCVADLNNDGWDDVFFITGSGNRRHFGRENWWVTPQPNRIYLNKEGVYFDDITELSGINVIEFGLACATADLDNDGFIDLIVANKGGNSIYKNMGGGKFTLQKKALSDDPALFSTSILVKDFNDDGLQDILFGNYVNFTQDQNILELHAGYQNQKSINFDPALYDAQPDALFINNGNLQFSANATLTNNNQHGRTLGFYENESILALNDRGSPSQIVYLPDKNTNLQKIVLNARDAANIESPDNSGKNLFVASDAVKGGLYAIELGNHDSNDKSWDYDINSENNLYLNSWAVITADFNNDGYKDIFTSNGLAIPHPDAEMTTVGQANTLLLANPTAHRFEKIKLNNERILSSRGAAYFDFNNDGALDIVINNNNDYASLLTNKTPRTTQWLGLRCIPEYLCEQATITLNNKPVEYAFKAKKHYMSQSTTGLILTTNDDDKNTVRVVTKGSEVSARIDDNNRYYLIDLKKQSIAPIPKRNSASTQDTLAKREELIFHIKANINNDTTKTLTVELLNTETEHKIAIINAIQASGNHSFFPLIEQWANNEDGTVSVPAIHTLKKLETEETIPTLLNLLESDNESVSCAASDAFEYFYWKDEAVIERKKWAVAALVKRIDTQNIKIRTCAINALAESESYRALAPLLTQLKSNDDWTVSSAAHGLGMLRQTEAIADLQKHLFNHSSPVVRAQALVALMRLNVTFTEAMESKIFQKSRPFNIIFALTLDKLDDAVTTAKLSKSFNNRKIFENYEFLKVLSVEELNNLYQKIIQTPEPDTAFLKLASTNANEINITQFTFLKNLFLAPEKTAELFLRLRKTDQGDNLNDLSEEAIAQLLALDPLIVINICKVNTTSATTESPCNYANKLQKLPPQEIISNLIKMLNSGMYKTTALVGQALRDDPHFSLARNQLFSDNRLLAGDKLYLLKNSHLDIHSLSFINEFFMQLNPNEQLIALDAIAGGISVINLKSWLDNLYTQLLPQSTKFHIQGILAKTLENQ